MTDVDNNQNIHFAMLKALGMSLGIVPTFIGVAIGIRETTMGICNSAEIKLEMSLTIIPMAFTSASLIYSLIVFFLFFGKEVKSYEMGFSFIAASTFSGIGGMLSSYAIGGISRHACVTKAQQKKFTTQFFLMMIFAELIGIFSLIMTIVYGLKAFK